jgi:D-arabinose 1-dehydrogenase-like Zn-dependent alcohol dehydrogenase
MKAARLHNYHEALKVEEIDEPKILGPLDVIVKIGAAGLCRTDLHIQEGQWAEKSGVVLPYVPGHENAGWVHEVGSGVTNVVRAARATTCTASTASSPGSGATAASPSSCTRPRAR